MKRLRNIGVWPMVLIGLVGGIGWLLDATNPPDHPPDGPPRGLVSLDKEKNRQEAVRRAQLHLDDLRDESRRLANQSLKELTLYFEQAKKRTPRFADDVLGWGSKWRLLTDHTPYVGTDHIHSRYIANSFARNLFTKNDIEREIMQIVASLAAEVEGLEGEMLVNLRHDLANLPGEWRFEPIGKTAWEVWSRETQELDGHAAEQFLKAEIVQILVSAIVTEAALRVANRLGVSTVILGGSAAASKVSLGTSLLIGLAADQAVTWGWEVIADPKGEFVRGLDTRIDELHRILVEGSGSSVGLRQQFGRLVDNRDRVRRAAILNAINGKGGE